MGLSGERGWCRVVLGAATARVSERCGSGVFYVWDRGITLRGLRERERERRRGDRHLSNPVPCVRSVLVFAHHTIIHIHQPPSIRSPTDPAPRVSKRVGRFGTHTLSVSPSSLDVDFF